MGFDEIQYDYVRFPTDGNVSDAVWPHKVKESYANTIYRFLKTARAAIHPLGVNISANVFGLAAHEVAEVAQQPRLGLAVEKPERLRVAAPGGLDRHGQLVGPVPGDRAGAGRARVVAPGPRLYSCPLVS